MQRTKRHVHPHAVQRALAILIVASALPASADPAITAATDEELPAPRYPRAVIARPLTLPSHVVTIGADAGGNHDLSSMTGSPIVGYGITDKLEVQVPYAFATRDFEARGSIGADMGYAVVRGALDGKLEAIARIRGGYNVLDEAASPLMAGLHVQYNVTPTFAVISGAPGTQQLRVSLAKDATMSKPIDLSLPLGLGFQPIDTVYLQVDTRLAQLSLHDSQNAVIGKDIVPVALTVVWNAIHALDIQAAIATDLLNKPGDSLAFLVGVRYYAGEL